MVQSSYARRVLWGNAIFSGVSGGLFSFASTIVAALLGVDAPRVVMIIGIGLLAYAALIMWYVTRPTVSRTFVLCAAIADTVWVLTECGAARDKYHPTQRRRGVGCGDCSAYCRRVCSGAVSVGAG